MQGVPLWKTGTQTVFGAGAAKAEVMFVGEQPGDVEDQTGQPFVGPAGKLFDRALEEAGIDRSAVYVTNAVKHFKWDGTWQAAYPPEAQLVGDRGLQAVVGRRAQRGQASRPHLSGGNGAQALLGRQFRVTKQRGQPVESELAPVVIATVHPSAILRADDREAEFAAFVDDLKTVARYCGARRVWRN